jgi:ferritin-like metal-binding protein YciE
MTQQQNIESKKKFALMFNAVLAMENAACKRLETRINEVSLPDAKQQLQHHLEETKEQQKRLQDIIKKYNGTPTTEELGLPLPSYPESIKTEMESSMTEGEKELKKAEEDLVLEKAEATCYNMIIEKARILNMGTDAVPILEQNLREEQSMIDWIESNCPTMIQQLISK